MPDHTTSRKRGKMMQWIGHFVGPVIAISGAAIVVYGGLSVAQNDIKHLENSEKKQDKILKEIPAMAADIENIEEDMSDMNEALVRIEKMLIDSAVENGKFHHKHNGG